MSYPLDNVDFSDPSSFETNLLSSEKFSKVLLQLDISW